MISLIVAIAFSVAFIYACVLIAKPSGWHQCPECSWWHHEDGGYSYDEPETWDGVYSERICTSCEAISKHFRAEKSGSPDKGRKRAIPGIDGPCAEKFSPTERSTQIGDSIKT